LAPALPGAPMGSTRFSLFSLLDWSSLKVMDSEREISVSTSLRPGEVDLLLTFSMALLMAMASDLKRASSVCHEEISSSL